MDTTKLARMANVYFRTYCEEKLKGLSEQEAHERATKASDEFGAEWDISHAQPETASV